MSIKKKEFTLNMLADKFDFIKGSYFYQFYQELDKLYEKGKKSDMCKTHLFSDIDDPYVITFLIKVSGILKSLLNKEISVNNTDKLEDKQCIYLKYWIYDKLIDLDFDRYNVNMSFQFLKKYKKGCITFTSSREPCIFYKLCLKDIYDIKNLYDYSELLFNVDMKMYDKISEDSKYLDYFKKGLDLYKRSKMRCPTDTQNEYCYEFNEYERIHNKYKKELPFLSCQEKELSSLFKKDTTLTKESSQKDNTPDVTIDYELRKLLDNILDKVKLNSFYELLTKHNANLTSNSCVPANKYPIKEETLICNLFEKVKSILDKLDKTYAKSLNLSPDKTCNYLNYWLYDKLKNIDATPCDIEIFYFLWHQYVMDNKDIINKCNNEKSYGFSKKELGNKKKLFDFLEYYNEIREKLKEDNNKNKKSYCYYIRSIFELYKYMVHNNSSQEYTEELWLFRKSFLGNKELHLLKNKCPNMCLDLVFDEKYKTLCPLDEKPSVIDEEVDLNLCETAEVSTVNRHIGKTNEKEYIFEDLNVFGVYNELNREVITDNYYNICSKLLEFSTEHCGIYGLCIKLARNVKDLYHLKNKERASDCLYNTTNVNFEEQKEKKHLHDYFKDFDKIGCDNAINSTKCKSYCEYVTHINGLYGKHFSNCCYCFKSGGCMNMCPDYFKCDDTYSTYNLFETLKCKENEKPLGRLKKVVKPLPVDYHAIRLTEYSEKEKEKSSLMLEEKESSIVSEKESSIVSVKESSIAPEKESSNTPEKNCDKITCDSFYVAALGAFGLMGFFLMSFIFFKFTPLGSYFHNKNKKKKKTYFEQSEEQFLENDFEFNRTHTKNRRMRLAYHQA
ncbi:PIR Superfamily Protein [Plasmodium ovale curtisi]|uniref:PIR Superfamily Protein n=1 Tax=Plasmodium ovale curtisi TaxID=864141 RepID=A0A1A8WLS0_PLAOA|nr:PIR Superfamily Protein [Plasmodium ovale curtisi]